MRGGAQSHLMRCDDGACYVVKFQNNPQHVRVLANEMLATRMAARLGLPVPRVEVVRGDERTDRADRGSGDATGRGTHAVPRGAAAGVALPGRSGAARWCTIFCRTIRCGRWKISRDFAGMLVFDKWTCNTNGRQAVFFFEPGQSRRQAMMIDQGFCFNAGEWNFPDAPLRGLYLRHRVYEQVTGMDSFEPWLGRVEQRMSLEVLGEIAEEIPPEWYNHELDELGKLLARLRRAARPACAS